jgi:hypothetical protein
MLAQLQKLLDGEKGKFEHNGVTVSNDGGVVQVMATGIFTPPMSFTLSEAQLRLLHGFVNTFNSNEVDKCLRHLDTNLVLYDTYLVKLEEGIRLVADNEFEQNELDLYEDGTATVFYGWRSADYWDQWFVSSDGSVEYTGTVEGYRRVPAWFKRATEVKYAR